MKKVILEIVNYLSYFWVSLSILFAMAIYLMWRLPVFFWFGGNYKTNFFGSSLYGDVYYILVLFHVLLPFAIIFLVLSLFIWLYYRNDKTVSKIGFKNIIIGVFAIFLLFLLPAQAYFTSQKVREYQDMQAEELAQSRKGHVKSPSPFEIFKLYQSLADDGIQAWRTDPLAVTQFETKAGGVLSYFSGQDNALTLQSKIFDKVTGHGTAVVELKNERYSMEIILGQHLRHGEDGIWRVKQYKQK